MENPYLVFCCYVRKDQEFLQAIKTNLKSLEREGLITVKADVDISPATEWEPALMHDLDVADIILLLISPDFIASDYCFNEEMQRAIKRHEQGTARVVPVIIRPALWHRMPFGKLQALPKDATPISISKNIDTALLSVTKGIRIIVQELITGITAENPLWPSVQEDLLPTSIQERNDMDTRDDSSRYTIENSGPVYGQVIGGQHGQVISGQNVYITPNKQKDGIRSLEKGSKALLNRDYSSARKELRVAIEEIDQEQQKREAAKARYLQMLAVLAGERLRDQGIAGMEKINRLLNTAISLDQCTAYVMTGAVIRNPALQRQANSTRITDYDKELLDYLKYCQPDLYYQVCQVFGI